jgi:NhaA family Na+:H+ antiporter
MKFWRVEANAAYALIAAALLGILAANSPLSSALDAFRNVDVSLIGTTFTLEGWIYSFGLPVFFFLVGLELKRELRVGELSPLKRAVVPAVAATLGVAFPALAYLAVVGVGNPISAGWAIPTATDVTFALAAFAIFGKALPQSARSFLLAYAVIDDLIAVLIIAALFSAPIQPEYFALVIVWVALFALAARSKQMARRSWLQAALMVATGFGAIYFTNVNGLQPTLTAVVLGLLVPTTRTQRIQDAIHPVVSFTVMPLFALFAAGVSFGELNLAASAVLWAIMLRPIGKTLGITLGAELGKRVIGGLPTLPTAAIVPTALLGGAGFTVALLVAKYSFALRPGAEMAAVAATFIATAVSLVAGAIALKRFKPRASQNR